MTFFSVLCKNTAHAGDAIWIECENAKFTVFGWMSCVCMLVLLITSSSLSSDYSSLKLSLKNRPHTWMRVKRQINKYLLGITHNNK